MAETGTLSRQVLGCAFEVSNSLRTGFLELVYENALCIELAERKFNISSSCLYRCAIDTRLLVILLLTFWLKTSCCLNLKWQPKSVVLIKLS